MTDEQKIKYNHIMILAIRVLTKQITNLQYQLANFSEAAVFVSVRDIENLVNQRSYLDGVLYAATQVIENEDKNNE